MNHKLDVAAREELLFGVYDSSRDIIEVNGMRQSVEHFHSLGLWKVAVEVAIATNQMPCVGSESEFERFAARVKGFEIKQEGQRLIYCLTF